MARQDATGMRLITRGGSNFVDRFPRIAETVAQPANRVRLIDGEAIVVDANGIDRCVAAAIDDRRTRKSQLFIILQ
jgi:ATP-dependent DNA ligase